MLGMKIFHENKKSSDKSEKNSTQQKNETWIFFLLQN
jgi:hypothetical protein